MSATRQFWYLPMDVVHYGAGAVEALGAELDRLDARRAMVVTSPTVRAHPRLGDRVQDLLGNRLVAVFDGVRPHVPYGCLQPGLETIHDRTPDVLVSLGSGSVVDAARALALAAGEGLRSAVDLARWRATFVPPATTDIPTTSGRALPIVAIPTTLSAAEFANAGAVTDEDRQTKDLLIADELTPRSVLLDPELGVTTPVDLWASTGMRALDHAIETVYSPRRGPITDALALDAVRRLSASLRAAQRDPSDVDARCEGQLGAWESYFGEMNLTLGLSHAIGHQIGARYRVQHGWTTCAVLPSVMRWLTPATAERQALIASAFGVDTAAMTDEEAAEAAATEVERLVGDLRLPASLGELGVRQEELGALADAVMQDLVVAGSPRPVQRDDVVAILERAS
ncbi:iron-containing alcohol dehydrogenase [Georgenia sp. AZ-5]|uniref:iron-containing alcohol dehydrogenase n=1 Tax=Georgenia sp. AZ-5 TaxID=3367526 RepID=UPI003754FB8B